MTPIIVEGAPRSGTRFLCNFIEYQFQIKIYRIQRIIHKYCAMMEKYGDLGDDLNLMKFLRDLEKEILVKERIGEFDIYNVIKKVKKYNRTFGHVLYELLSMKTEQNNCLSWGLKFDNPSGMEICKKLFSNVKYIHILRDGRDVHLSASKTLSEGYCTPLYNALFWKKLTEERRLFGKALPKDHYLELKYETLLSEPEMTANEIAQFLGNNKYDYKEVDIKKNNFGKWKKNMRQSQIRVYEAIAGELLAKLGYELVFADAKLNCFDAIYYGFIEKPAKIKKYVAQTWNPKYRSRVIRRIKLKLNEKTYFRN